MKKKNLLLVKLPADESTTNPSGLGSSMKTKDINKCIK